MFFFHLCLSTLPQRESSALQQRGLLFTWSLRAWADLGVVPIAGQLAVDVQKALHHC